MIRNTDNLNVLIVDDSTADSFLITELLDEIEEVNYSYKHCELFGQVRDAIDNEYFDVVLLDLHLPDTNGISHLDEFNQTYGHIPFIILTGLDDKDISLEALHRGASDYLIKGDFNATLLHRSILYTLERKRLEEESVTKMLAAQDQEKERIARDVHDSLGQNLTSAIMHLQTLESQLSNENKEVQDSLKVSIKCINEAINESRGISRSLMPQTVQKFGLESGIEGILYMLTNNISTKFEFNSNLEGLRFDYAVELAYFRIAQEALNNALKYAKAEKVNISLNHNKSALVMIIADNGIGFHPESPENQKGVGINSMRTRARSVSAEFNIDSEVLYGTTIRLSLKTKPDNGKD